MGPPPRSSETIELHITSWQSIPKEHVEQDAFGRWNHSNSRTFSMAMKAVGELWKLELVPGGMSVNTLTDVEKEKAKGHIAAFLHYLGEKDRVRVRVSLNLVNHELDEAVDFPALTFTTTFGKEPARTSQGFPNLIIRETIEDESEGWKQNDCVKLRATITSLDLVGTVAAAERPFLPLSTITADLKLLFTSSYRCDITINCGNRTFTAHKCVLGIRSGFFKGLFASAMRDADADGLPVTDTEPDVFEQLLLWIYTGEVAEAALQAKDMLEHLFMAANRYACGGLKLLCEAKLCEGLAVDNAAARLVLSEQAKADELKEACLEFIKSDAAAVMGTEGWRDVTAAGVELVNEVLAAFVAGGHGGGSADGEKRMVDEAGLSAQDAEVEEMRKLKMQRLKNDLQDRHLPADGRRWQLQKRLASAMRSEMEERTDLRRASLASGAEGSSSSSYSQSQGTASASGSSSGNNPHLGPPQTPGSAAAAPIQPRLQR